MWWYIAVFVVALVVGFSSIPKPQTRPPAGISEFKVPTAEVGREIPVLFGTRKIEAPNVVYYGHLKIIAIRKKAKKK